MFVLTLTVDYIDSVVAWCVDAAGDKNCDNNYVRSVRLHVLIGWCRLREFLFLQITIVVFLGPCFGHFSYKQRVIESTCKVVATL